MKFVKIFYVNGDSKTVTELLKQQKITNVTGKEFLDTKDPLTNRSNREALFASYKEQQKKDLGLSTADDISEDTQIYPPAVLFVQSTKATLNLLTNESTFTKHVDYDAFLSEQQKNIVESRDYEQSKYTKSYPEVTVWVWSKSIDNSSNDGNNIHGALINLTSFIEDIKINSSEVGGSFSITLPFIPMDGKGQPGGTQSYFSIKKSKMQSYNTKDGVTEYVVNETIHQAGVEIIEEKLSAQIQGDNSLRNIDIGSAGLNVNDIVFIKYERLKLENSIHIDDFNVDYKALTNEIFDMICLVDSVTTSTENTSIVTTVTGRDLMKLILDDSSFFFPNSYANPDAQKGIFQNMDENHGDGVNTWNNLIRTPTGSAGRFITSGILDGFWNNSARTIENVVSLVVKTLANIEICPDEIFESYAGKRTRFRKSNTVSKK